MKIKTSELTGSALDWAVAKCEGVSDQQWKFYSDWNAETWRHEDEKLQCYAYSSYWAQGGPIIERELIAVCLNEDGDTWAAWYPMRQGLPDGVGNTPLIAAMRCYVTALHGDEVDVPDGLQ